jgi:hypothetical protein
MSFWDFLAERVNLFEVTMVSGSKFSFGFSRGVWIVIGTAVGWMLFR